MVTAKTITDSSNSSSSSYKNGSSRSSSSSLSPEKAGSSSSSTKRSASNFDHDSDDDNILIDGESLIKSSEMKPLTEMNGENGNEKLLPLDGNDDDAGHRMEVFETEYYEPSSLSSSWEDWLYPPSLPRSCQLLRRENIAIPACYLLVGILQGLSGPLINVYPLDLGATEAQQQTIWFLKGLPSCFKIIFGFLSDNYPIFGYRRKSYMMIGWLFVTLIMVVLLNTCNLTMKYQDRDPAHRSPAARGADG